MEKRFYGLYQPVFARKKTSDLITTATYDYIVQRLQSCHRKPRKKHWTLDEHWFHKIYRLQGNTKGRCLRRLGVGNSKQWLLVPTFEEVFPLA
jgi:hypothetical protein